MTHKKKLYGNNGGSSADAGLSFRLPLQTSVRPTFARGSSTATFTRATTKSIVDFEGLYKTCLSGEVGFSGARRVENLVPNSSDLSVGAGWTVSGVTITAGKTDPVGGTTAYRLTATAPHGQWYKQLSGLVSGDTLLQSVYIKRVTGSGAISDLTVAGGTGTAITVTTSWQLLAPAVRTSTGTTAYLGLDILTSGDEIDIWFPVWEKTTGQTNQNPSERVSKGVLSAPYHGAGVDGVKYFSTLNGNTVSSNVVTEATGAAINSSQGACAGGATAKVVDATGPVGYNAEPAATNVILQSNTLNIDNQLTVTGGSGSFTDGETVGDGTRTGIYRAAASTSTVFALSGCSGTAWAGTLTGVSSGATRTISSTATVFQLSNAADMNAVVADQYASIDGTTTMDKLQPKNTTAVHSLNQAFTFTAAVYTLSGTLRYVSATPQRWVALVLNDGTTTWAASFDLLNGTAGAVSNCTSTIAATAQANVYKFTVTKSSAAAAAAGTVKISLNATDTATLESALRAGTETLGVGFLQLETGSVATSPITTTTVAVTRNADLLTYVASGNIGNVTGTAYLEYTPPSVVPVQQYLLADSGNRQLIAFTGALATQITDTSNTTNWNASALVASTVRKIAVNWSSAFPEEAQSGTLLTRSASQVVSFAFANIQVGGTVNVLQPGGCLRNVRIYGSALSAAQLQVMTT